MKVSKEQHFHASAETSEILWPQLERIVASGISAKLKGPILSDMEYYMRLRRGKPLLRPLMARFCLELTSDANWQDFAPLLIAVELFNISTYQSNFCFDEKAGVKATSERNNQFICSMLTFSRAINLVSECRQISADKLVAIKDLLATVNHELYEGQYSDLNILNIDRLKDDEIANYDSFRKLYLQRCYHIAGSTLRACAITALAQDTDPLILETLNTYLLNLGAAGQAVNDLGDFIPHTTKVYAAPFADVQLGRLTLPMYLLAQAGVPLQDIRNELRNNPDSEHCRNTILDAIDRNNIEKRVRMFIKKELFPQVKSSLANLTELVGEQRVASLHFAFNFIYESRLLRYFRQDRSRAWHEEE